MACDRDRAVADRGVNVPPGKKGIGYAPAKVILAGEHAVLYGSRAVVTELGIGVSAVARSTGRSGIRLVIPGWELDEQVGSPGQSTLARAIATFAPALPIERCACALEVHSDAPPGAGLGSSSAFIVAALRALSDLLGGRLNAQEQFAIAHRAEQAIHGTSSGVDCAASCFGGTFLFQPGAASAPIPVERRSSIVLLVILTPTRRETAQQIRHVKELHRQRPSECEEAFREIDAVAMALAQPLRRGAAAEVGQLFAQNQRILASLGLSCPELETAITLACSHGATGAKLTGAGGGGAIVAAADGDAAARVEQAARRAGLPTFRC